MPEYITPGDYAVKTEKWRKTFQIPSSIQYDDQVEIANTLIDELSMNDPQQHDILMQEANAWAEKEGKRLEEYAPSTQYAAPQSIAQQLENIPIGTYLMLTGHYGNAINPTIEQGKLKSLDVKNNTVVLHNTVYDREVTVKIDQILSIDASRSGSGARGSVQQADLRRVGNDWYRGNKKL